ncbi:hypothetical protein [Flagellimonas allohymeniacidonis]|uniref:Uncharacterized protein n=1 Tax=Flagellimonas allohymeniacidonis TaxID=2517819 RepID=A0A4Q8QHS6_9FLAO|nr:hypothetical protein [Allomuricauda hymeniacidonis]TAI47726.1 hypothetical protein EW142_13785 [Allomuricauda hymeniacidonis]
MLLFLFKVLKVVRTIAFPFIAFMLTFSIMAPSLLPLLHKDCEVAFLVDTGEEEKKSEKESEKKADEKNLFLNNSGFSQTPISFHIASGYIEHSIFDSDFIGDILLPPPRQMA